MKKLFGGIELTWKKLIIFAILCGLYAGIMIIIPITRDTSFRDIGITFECWILFGIIIIINSKSAVDSALKCFVFFLISQPLIYLVQVPFNSDGFGIFRYYPGWFIWTLFTLPMGYVGYYMKKDKWWGLLILVPMLLFLGYHYKQFLTETISFFPQHLITTIFCLITLIIYPLYIFDNKKIKIIGLSISIIIILLATIYSFSSGRNTYNTSLLISGGEMAGIEYDDTYKVYLKDESYGKVYIHYLDSIETYIVNAEFRKTGETQVILESPNKEKYIYDIIIYRNSYNIEKNED